MGTTVRLTLVLAFVAAVAAGALAMTYDYTKEEINQQEQVAKVEALKKVFFNLETVDARPVESAPGVSAIYLAKDDPQPAFYAAEGQGIGYNASVPIRLLVGFTAPTADAPELLKPYVAADNLPATGSKGLYIVGWRVVKSEETPGLGEKAKEEKAPFTFAQLVQGTAEDAGSDWRTAFHRQFAGLSADAVKLKKNGGTIDVITAATYSTAGIVAAIRDAAANVQKAQQ